MASDRPDDPSELVPLEEVERRYVLRVLEAAGGNKSVAARILGVDRKTLYRRLESYGVASESAPGLAYRLGWICRHGRLQQVDSPTVSRE